MFSVLVFLCVLSVLIFVHEFGHFIAAKLCGIYVDRFSIGMPPRLFGVRLGETDYCISALPIGGYVKMAGQEDAPLSEEERERDYGNVPPERWLNNKPYWQRLIVFVAGPAMNFVLAIVLYGVLAAAGREVPELEVSSRIGEIDENGPAAAAPLWMLGPNASETDTSRPPDATGWLTGDTIVSIDGAPITKYNDIFFAAVVGGPEKEHNVILDRPLADGGTQRYLSKTAPKVFGDFEHPRFGVAPYSSCIVEKVEPDSPAQQIGLQKDDVIEKVDGVCVDKMTFIKKTQNTPEGAEMRLTIARGTEHLDIAAVPKTVGRVLGAAFGESDKGGRLIVVDVDEKDKATLGLLRGDVIAKIDGEPATMERLNKAQEAKSEGVITMDIERPAILFGLMQKASTLTVDVPLTAVRAVGVELGVKTVHLVYPVTQWPREAMRGANNDMRQTFEILYGLVSGKVSTKVIGGPVMIFDATAKMARAGWTWLVGIMALISVNLAVFNLLPLPILDGGQVVLNTIEAIIRRPLNPKFVERYQQVGLVLIVAFMLFVTSNDIMRLITSMKP